MPELSLPLRALPQLLLVVIGWLLVATHVRADVLYPAIKIECDRQGDLLRITNITAYNDDGVANSDESNGVYVPNDTLPSRENRDVPAKEYNCRTKSAEFRVQLKPLFGQLSVSDTFAVLVKRNGATILPWLTLDADERGIQSNTYVTSIVARIKGKPAVTASCREKALLDSKCVPSFDCAKAISHVEHLICEDEYLSFVDYQLAEAYATRLQKAADPNRLREEQRRWLKARNACTDTACLRSAYEMRRSQLTEPAPKQ